MDSIPKAWLEEFEAAARRPLETRFKYSFIKTFKPVLDEASWRSFDTMEEYRRWCEEVEGFPVCHPDDIIASKAAANRAKDRESLPRLRSFRDYWVEKSRRLE